MTKTSSDVPDKVMDCIGGMWKMLHETTTDANVTLGKIDVVLGKLMPEMSSGVP